MASKPKTTEWFIKKAKCTFGSLFKKTLDKEAEILQNGYIIVSIWEQDFLKSL